MSSCFAAVLTFQAGCQAWRADSWCMLGRTEKCGQRSKKDVWNAMQPPSSVFLVPKLLPHVARVTHVPRPSAQFLFFSTVTSGTSLRIQCIWIYHRSFIARRRSRNLFSTWFKVWLAYCIQSFIIWLLLATRLYHLGRLGILLGLVEVSRCLAYFLPRRSSQPFWRGSPSKGAQLASLPRSD